MDFTATFHELEAHCKLYNHRQLIVVAGERGWGEHCIGTFIQDTFASGRKVTWMTEDKGAGRIATVRDDCIHPSLVMTRLGTETDCIVFDAHKSFDGNAFAAISGTLNGGGLFFLLIPALEDWPMGQPSSQRFLTRLVKFILEDTSVCLLQQKSQQTRQQDIEPRLPVFSKLSGVTSDSLIKTPDQQSVVDSIVTMALSKTPYPVVMTADRGRGKSAALGIAAAQLMSASAKRIIITAPRFEVSKVFFRHLKDNCSNATQHRGSVSISLSHCEFVPPDKLLLNQETLKPEADLLMVDEAAAIPAFILQRLLDRYPAIVFSTTTHGYEGSGQGFFVRFQQTLDLCNPNWVKKSLHTPIRWSDNDPLESFTNYCMFLDAAPAKLQPSEKPGLNEFHFTEIDLDALATNEQQLGEIAGLLKQAHYRTRPSDMVQLLDAPESSLVVCCYQQHIIAVLWFVSEGGLSEDLAHQVYCGKRRPGGHMIPQSLAHHAGIAEAATLRYNRIVRIAVHQDFRRTGVGSQLLQQLIDISTHTQKTDIVGASFGTTPELLKFWQANGFVAARMGLKRNASSGTHSLIMLLPVSERGSMMTACLNRRFRTQITDTLELLQPGLDPDIYKTLTQELRGAEATQDSDDMITAEDQKDINSFTQGYRGFELNITVLKKLITSAQKKGVFLAALNTEQQKLLDAKLVTMKSNQSICADFGFTGKQELDSAVKMAITRLYSTMTLIISESFS